MEPNKPLSVLRVEFINSLVALINNSNLPPFVIEPILRDSMAEVNRLTNEQYERDNAEYQQALAKFIAEENTSSDQKK